MFLMCLTVVLTKSNCFTQLPTSVLHSSGSSFPFLLYFVINSYVLYKLKYTTQKIQIITTHRKYMKKSSATVFNTNTNGWVHLLGCIAETILIRNYETGCFSRKDESNGSCISLIVYKIHFDINLISPNPLPCRSQRQLF